MNDSRPSRWGAPAPTPQQQPSPPAGGGFGGGVDGSGVGGPDPRRDRSQSWNNGGPPPPPPRRGGGGRGYDTTDAPAADPSGFNARGRDDSRGRWGQGDRRDSGGGRWGGDDDHRRNGGGRPSFDNERPRDERGGDDRRCKECGLIADPRDERCPRCGTWKDDGPPRDRDKRSFDGEDRYRRDDDRGRDDRGHGGRRGRDDDDFDRDRRPKKPRGPKPRLWPPHFETDGSSYVFDARSGMFYEPSSDFFYDPKTKLYYGNKKQQYYRYDADKKPFVYQPVGGANGGAGGQAGGPGAQQQVVTVAEENGEVPLEEPNAEARPEPPKPKIAITLKTAVPKDGGAGVKSLKEAAAEERSKLQEQKKIQERAIRKKESTLSDGAENAAGKKRAKDLDKWSERQRESRDDGGEASSSPQKIKTTASGQPICVLCRRKFASVEKLRQHEKLSPMHKENLAKKAAADAAKRAAREKSDTSYRDRTKERRAMYGTHADSTAGASHAEALLAQSLGSSSQPKEAEVIRPEETLNDSNVGNKLLQKMGWKSGDGLGRANGAGGEASAGSDGTRKDDVAGNLKSDWERIESMAQRGGGR